MKFKFIIGLLLALVSQGFTQEEPSSSDDETLALLDMSKLSFERLADSALIYSPYIHYSEASLKSISEKIKVTQVAILNTISVNGSYNYGNQGLVTIDGNDPSGNSLIATSTSTRFNVGAAVKIPFDQVFGRSHQIKQYQFEREMAEANKEKAILELRSLLLKNYYDLQLKNNILRLQAQSRQSSYVNMKLAEKLFESGEIDLGELSRTSEAYNKAAVEYETSKANYYYQYYLLQELVGVELINLLK